VSLLIRRDLTERAKDFNIILDDVAITELSFSKEYTAAVESKQVAQQEAQRAQFMVEKAKQEQRQKIVQAEGEAAAASMISFGRKPQSPLGGSAQLTVRTVVVPHPAPKRYSNPPLETCFSLSLTHLPTLGKPS
ncbi:hypothetical protein scyTo_0024569, partial [Scyliorhinus torazame]|nr:hypothetical protein [Scyliorhinus torazame]